MRCSKCQELYDEAAAGALSDSLNRKVREHLASCPACSVVWQESHALRCVLRETAQPAVMPDAAYFARLAKQAIVQAQAQETEVSGQRPEARGLLDAMAGLLTGLRFGVAGLARATALVAVGLIIGFGFSQGLKGGNRGNPAPSGFAKPASETGMSLDGQSYLPAGVVPIEGIGARPVAFESIEKPGLITKLDQPAQPPVDPALFVQTWQKTVALLDKMSPSDEVERLRQIQKVSRQVQASAVLTRLQDLKLQLVRSGQTDYIPDVHRIEEVFNQLAAASRESRASEFAHLDTYQKAEEALIQKRHDEAMRLFKMVVIQAPSSYLAARATHQMGNISFEHFRDYKNALIDYDQCLNEYPRHFLSEPILGQIHERIDLITQNSMDNYGPLWTFAQAGVTTQPATALALYATLLKQYPQSPLVRPAIEAMTQIARQAADDTSSVNQLLEVFEQFQDQNPSHPFALDAQLGVADVTNFCVRNRSQAVLEYTKILEKAKDPQKIKTVQERLRSLAKAR
jgi:TolA-binding protein